MLQYLIRDIRSISFREGRRDRTVWLADPSNFYSVKSAYGFLSEASSLGITSLYKKVCNKFVPLKVCKLFKAEYCRRKIYLSEEF
jgi:hypothetical protein